MPLQPAKAHHGALKFGGRDERCRRPVDKLGTPAVKVTPHAVQRDDKADDRVIAVRRQRDLVEEMVLAIV